MDDFAARLGMTKNNLYRIERGKSGAPNVLTIVRFARVLGVQPSEIVQALDER
jgi:transcriptional regulator with XRE-family HTH domain